MQRRDVIREDRDKRRVKMLSLAGFVQRDQPSFRRVYYPRHRLIEGRSRYYQFTNEGEL